MKTNPGIHAATGSSDLPDSFEAGVSAASEALSGLSGRTPQVLMVFGAMRFDHRDLLKGVMSIFGTVPIVGGTTAGEISTAGYSTGSVVVMAIASDYLQFVPGIGHNMSSDERACAVYMASDILSKGSFGQEAALLVFPNGMGGDGLRVLDGLHSVLGPGFEILGGYLGDDERFQSTFQYYNGMVYRDAIVGLMIYYRMDCVRTGIGVRSGFESIGNSFVCTASEGNIVREFDHVRALDLYKDFLGEERSARLPGVCLEYPFGLIDPELSTDGSDMFQLRCGLSVDHAKGTISLAASIPSGSSVTLTTASRGDIIQGARMAAEQALAGLSGAIPRLVVMFSCVGRKLVLGRRIQEEVAAIKECFGEKVPLIGFYTYGEIGPVNKMKPGYDIAKFHNETVVLWVIGEEYS